MINVTGYSKLIKELFGSNYDVFLAEMTDSNKVRVEINYIGTLFRDHKPFVRIYTDDVRDDETAAEALGRLCKRVMSLYLKACFLDPSTAMTVDFLDKNEPE